ncbi:PhoH family protein [Crateriforma conspicua]|uniref:PhoH family protein n=1 Tax=Crateriforma conspicua TaxID=2527996 RepID=UPI0011AAF33C|nr:PhoH family protein [Crateriforma conspicua]
MDQRSRSASVTGQEIKRKLFVLDTNVILHDSQCLRSFQEHDVVIPITVLEELDGFKKGHGDINYQARAFLRVLDELTGDVLNGQGASLGQGYGRIRVVWKQGRHERIKQAFFQDSPDHRIVGTALELSDHEDRPVVLVSKDTNIRMKAKAFGLVAQDYIRDKVESVDKLYTGKRRVEIEEAALDQFYDNGHAVPAETVPVDPPPVPNENLILRSGAKSVLASYDESKKEYHRVDKTRCYGITPRNAEQSFALHALVNTEIRLVTLAGKAGTGKTLLALAAALHRRSEYRQILLARPVVPLSNRDLGFLPGDVHAKLDPYMQPLYDNLAVIRHQFDEKSQEAQRINQMLELEKLVITPLAYIRGRTLQRTFFIVDEAQNLTPHEVKTIITRAGEGTKIIFTGDVNQIDHPYLDALSNGLSYLISRMTGQSIYSHITLEKGERSELADLATALL